MEDLDLLCVGCGAQIQTEDKAAMGYLPLAALENHAEDEALYCQRCFRLRHYNEIAPISLTDEDFLRILADLKNKKALIVNVVDIFDFNGSIIPELGDFIGNNPLLLVANKRDILPKSLKITKLKKWVKDEAERIGLHPIDTQVISAYNSEDIASLMEELDKLRKGRDVYIVGTTNVGKSTLINAIIKQATGEGEMITTSRFPGTTLDKIEISLDNKSALIDTPGIIHRGQMAHLLDDKDLKFVSPKKEIKPTTFQLNPGQTLFIGGLARFDFISGARQGFNCYFENNLLIHRTKLAAADSFYDKHQGELLQPSVSTKLIAKKFSVNAKSDLVIAGLGWIRVPEKAQVALWAPEGIDLVMRKALI